MQNSLSGFKKIPITVEARFNLDGIVEPIAILCDEDRYEIDKIYNSRIHSPQLYPCYLAIEYAVLVGGFHRYLYYDQRKNEWFTIKKSLS